MIAKKAFNLLCAHSNTLRDFCDEANTAVSSRVANNKRGVL
jgi:hypothetical protein